MSCPDELAPKLLGALARVRLRPLALRGRSGSGKTTLLRQVLRLNGREAHWTSAFDMAADMVEAIRGDPYADYCGSFARDTRILCVEHLEDLRSKPCTRGQVRHLLESRAARGCPVLVTATRTRGDADPLSAATVDVRCYSARRMIVVSFGRWPGDAPWNA
jgi:chromosomal replication initiation ATPase DnaA